MTVLICPAVIEDQGSAAGYRCTIRQCSCFADEQGAGPCWLDEIERLRSMLMNARNILRDGGYVYALEIDKVLGAAPQKVE